jgi:hypothetical protein
MTTDFRKDGAAEAVPLNVRFECFDGANVLGRAAWSSQDAEQGVMFSCCLFHPTEGIASEYAARVAVSHCCVRSVLEPESATSYTPTSNCHKDEK